MHGHFFFNPIITKLNIYSNRRIFILVSYFMCNVHLCISFPHNFYFWAFWKKNSRLVACFVYKDSSCFYFAGSLSGQQWKQRDSMKQQMLVYLSQQILIWPSLYQQIVVWLSQFQESIYRQPINKCIAVQDLSSFSKCCED